MHTTFYRRPIFLILIIYAACVALFVKISQPKEQIFVEPPSKVMAAVKSFPRARDSGTTFEARVLAINDIPQNFRTIVSCPSGCRNLLKGDKVLLSAGISPIAGQQNFGSFDRAAFYSRKKIFTQTEASSAQVIGASSYLWITVSKIRNSILKVFNKNLSPDLSAIVSGITIGEKSDLPPELYSAFQDAGSIHLLVASGVHVGFATLIIYFVCSLFGARRTSSAVIALVLAALYALIAGGDTPVFRAYIMTFFSTVGFLLGRKSGVLHGLTMSALIILIISPQALFQVSFQMSFLATLAIVLYLSNFKINFRKQKLFKKITELFFISLAAQLALLPLFANYFQRISFTALLSNILLVPLSGVILGMGFFTWAVSLLQINFIFRPAIFALDILLTLFKIFVEFFAAFPTSRIPASAMNPFSIAAYYTALFAFLNIAIIKRKILYAVCCAAVVFVLLLTSLFTGRSAEHILHGRYNKALLIKESGTIKIIGAGVQGDILRRAVLASGSRTIDCLFLNGLSKSAVYGLSGLEDLRIKNIFIPQGDLSPEAAEKLPRLNAKITVIEPGDIACGAEAANPWYMTQSGGIFVRRQPEGSLSFSYKNFRTAGGMKDILTQAELVEKSL